MTKSDGALVPGAVSDVSSFTGHARLEMMPGTQRAPEVLPRELGRSESSDIDVG
jgi:hypothetical protein